MMLQSLPEMFSECTNNLAFNNWMTLGPITVEELLANSSDAKFSLESDQLEFKRVDLEDEGSYKIGTFKKGTEEAHGIVRYVDDDGDIDECLWLNDKRSGYGRKLFGDGDYYVGMWANDKHNGRGKFVFSDGDVEEGTFLNGRF